MVTATLWRKAQISYNLRLRSAFVAPRRSLFSHHLL